eukprot:Lankesteria_metandrocarpae@DN6051_c0_g1_i1.p3
MSVRSLLPLLDVHFSGLDLTADLYFLSWFSSVFSACVPIPALFRLWDTFFLFGEVYIYQLALGFLKYYEGLLLASSFERCVHILTAPSRYRSASNQVECQRCHTSREQDGERLPFDAEEFFECVDKCRLRRDAFALWFDQQRRAEDATELMEILLR